ncbi:hypothetical protein Tco_0594895 [Tanacetum coccineum]
MGYGATGGMVGATIFWAVSMARAYGSAVPIALRKVSLLLLFSLSHGYVLLGCAFTSSSSLATRQSPFKAPSGVFVIMSMVTISVTILASAILIFTSYFLKNYMRNIHYTILKSIGMLSGFLFIFSTECVMSILVTDKPNWSWYTVMGVIFIEILVLYYFFWKYALVHQQNFKQPHVEGWIYALFLACVCALSVSPSVTLRTIMPRKLFWVHYLIIFCTIVSLTQGTSSSPVIEQDIQTIIHPSVAT